MSKKLIIEIEDKDYERACKATMSFDGAMHIYQAIRESTPYNPSGDLISREALKKAIKDNGYSHYFEIFDIIDNAQAVPQVTVFTENADEKAVADLKAELQSVIEPRHQGECRTCRHRDPEDKKCDCGALERAGCPFPVSDDYFCKFYEKGGAE